MAKNGASITLRGVGLDCISNLFFDGYMRPIAAVNGVPCGSMVDLMTVFSESKNPRQYWKDHKAKFIGNDEVSKELVENLYRLKVRAPDGKMRETDVAPLWVCIFIAMRMDTPNGRLLAREVAKCRATLMDIKYRMGNIGRGMEWAADSIHQDMIDKGSQMTWGENGYDDDQPYRREIKR
jgi:hypothetical protein